MIVPFFIFSSFIYLFIFIFSNGPPVWYVPNINHCIPSKNHLTKGWLKFYLVCFIRFEAWRRQYSLLFLFFVQFHIIYIKCSEHASNGFIFNLSIIGFYWWYPNMELDLIIVKSLLQYVFVLGGGKTERGGLLVLHIFWWPFGIFISWPSLGGRIML